MNSGALVRRVLAEHLGHGFADLRAAFARVRLVVAHNLLAAATPDQLAVLAVVQVDLQGAGLVVQGAGFAVARTAPVAVPRSAPETAVMGGDLILALIDDQPDLHLEVAGATRRRQAQAALVELVADCAAG